MKLRKMTIIQWSFTAYGFAMILLAFWFAWSDAEWNRIIAALISGFGAIIFCNMLDRQKI